MKIIFINLLIILFFSTNTISQTSWQWGKRGGSASSGSFIDTEGEIEMVTDRNGNLYVLGLISKGMAANIDGHISSNTKNQLSLTKWDCNGNRKWTKLFGGNGSILVIGSSLAIDTLGGLYFTGSLSTISGSVYFDDDTTITATTKQWYLVKYDTSGILQWLKMPQPDTVTVSLYGTSNKSGAFGLDVSHDGNIYLLTHLAPGIFSEIFVNTSNTFYLLKYNKNGDFISAKSIEMFVSMGTYGPDLGNLATRRIGFARDHNSGNFYISGPYNSDFGTLTYGTVSLQDLPTIGKPVYLVAFDSMANYLWVEQSTSSGGINASYSRPRIDEIGNIYICGGALQGNQFFGHTFINHVNPFMGVPFVLSINSSGELNWGIDAGSKRTLDLRSIAYANGVISISDAWEEKIVWGGDSLFGVSGEPAIFLAKFNAYTGKLIQPLDSVKISNSPGFFTSDIFANKKGDVFVGGAFPSQIFLPSTTLTNIGGTFDFFVAKYGSDDCNCLLANPEFTYTSEPDNIIHFTYTGSTPVDSVVWEFGDGNKATGLTTNHTYSAPDTYGVSLVVYNNCGIIVDYKKVITGTNSMFEINAKNRVTIYPNPTTGNIIIEGAVIGTKLELYNNLGQKVLNTIIKENKQYIDISSLNSGMYIIHFIANDGQKGSIKVIKQ